MLNEFPFEFCFRPVVLPVANSAGVAVGSLVVVGSLIQTPYVLVHLLLVSKAFLTKAEVSFLLRFLQILQEIRTTLQVFLGGHLTEAESHFDL